MSTQNLGNDAQQFCQKITLFEYKRGSKTYFSVKVALKTRSIEGG